MNKIAGISGPANELERLIADLSESGPLIFVFGVGWWTGHLTGATAPVFRGPAVNTSPCRFTNWTDGCTSDDLREIRLVGGQTTLPARNRASSPARCS